MRWPVKQNKNTEVRQLAAVAKQGLHPINLSLVQGSRSSPQPWSVLFPNATSHQIKNLLFLIWLSAGTAFPGLTGIAENRGDLYCKFFLIWLTENLNGFTSNLYYITKDTYLSILPSRKTKYYSQQGALLHSLENSLFWTWTWNHRKAISSCTSMGRKEARIPPTTWGDWGKCNVYLPDLLIFLINI